MVYSSRFVMCVLVNGDPQKESHDGIVSIPFGSQYSLRFKNKNDRRAMVTFTIDGENVSGGGYVIEAHKSLTIHRYAQNAVQFKFVSLDSAEAVEEGKNGPNDGTKGVIVARFRLEKKQRNIPIPSVHPHKPFTSPNPFDPEKPWVFPGSQIWMKSASELRSGHKAELTGDVNHTFAGNLNMANSGMLSDRKVLQDGCTVEGAHSSQKFYEVPFDAEEDYTELRIVLKGFLPIVETDNGYCTGCGAKRSRSSDRFCGQCGQRL